MNISNLADLLTGNIQGHLCLCLQIDDSLTAGDVEKACSAGASSSFRSTVGFYLSITDVYLSNAEVDLVFMLSSRHHFDDETFQAGRDIITAGRYHRRF